MATPDLIKLAPTLSAEERYKIIFADLLGQNDGEPAKLSESELKAMLRFESKPIWRDYALHASMMRHANEIWIREIETEKLRTYAFYLHMSYQFQLIVMDDDIPEEMNAKRFVALKKSTADLHDTLEGFYAYRAAIPKLEALLYGVPFFSKTMQATVAEQFELVESSIQNYNNLVRDICAHYEANRLIKPIVDDIDSYLIPEAVPTDADVAELVDFIEKMAASEVQSRD